MFDELQRSLQAEGPAAAIERLCTALRERKDYSSLFYAMLLKKRHELGVSPVPSGMSQDLPEAAQAPYEDAIRSAGRLVGRLFLEEGDIARAWTYYRLIGEPAPVAEALDKIQPAEEDDVQPLVEIAFHHGVHPRKGFDLLLERFGLCNAITTASSTDFQQNPELRIYCITRLVHTLYDELRSRIGADVVQREGTAPREESVRALIGGRDWLFEEDCYHVDLSHLGSVVQMSVHLPPGRELEMCRELCAYGKKLSPRFPYAGDPPFENLYHDYDMYLAVVAGEKVEEGIAHFQAKVDNADPEQTGTGPAQVLVNLLLRLGRPAEALQVARRQLATADSRYLSCPGITELCQRANDFHALADVARAQGDAVHFLAGLIAAERK